MIATTLFGLEPLLKDELEKINAKKIQIGNRCVYFTGNNELMYRANIQLRTALKILKEISIFKSKNEHELYKNINRIKWDKIMTTSQNF
jgi:putative N6-adenine-specific DNA methylase